MSASAVWTLRINPGGFGGGDVMAMLGGNGGGEMMQMIPQLIGLANSGGPRHHRRHRRHR